MNATILPYGSAGWSRKLRLVEEILSSRPAPPCIYNDVLILVPSSRMKRIYSRLFLDGVERLYGRTALVQPEVHTMHQFFQRLYEKTGGPQLIDETSRLVLLEGIVKGIIAGKTGFGGNPDLLAPSLSASIADMIDQLSTAGILPDRLATTLSAVDFSDKPQVRLLADAYDRYKRTLAEKGLVDPSGLLAVLADSFDPLWLSPYSRIIIDGLHDAGGLRAALIRKFASRENCTLLIEAPAAEQIRRAGEHHPLRLVREYLNDIGLVPGPSATDAAREDALLSEAIFSNESFAAAAAKAPDPAAFSRSLRLLSAINAREEVSLIAGRIKQSLRQGTAADSILVAFPAIDEYGSLVEEIFIDYGIPYNRALGRQLGASAVAAAVGALLQIVQDDFSGPSLTRAIGSPFLKFGEKPAIATALDRLMRDERITAGRERWLSALKRRGPENGEDILAAPLRDLFANLDPFILREARPLSFWMDRLAELMAWAGIADRVTLIKGPLNMNVQAYRKMTECVASLDRAGRLFPEYRYTFSEWFFLLKKTFMHARFQVPPDDEGGVQVLGLEESAGQAWSEIYLGGLIDGKFPQRLPQNIFLPEATLEALGLRILEKARLAASYHFYRLLLSAPVVTLTYPENLADRPVIPSPFLEELRPLRIAGLLNRGMEKTAGIQFNLTIEESRSVPELAKALAVAENVTGLEKLLQADLKGLSGIRSALTAAPAADRSITPPDVRKFSVTELDDYLRCPYDYYVHRVLNIGPLEEVTDDLSPLDRGSKVHGILKAFYDQWKGPVTDENREASRMVLLELADSAFRREVDTFRNRREKDLFVRTMAERFLDAELGFWKQGFRPCCLEQKVGAFTLKLANGAVVELHGKIDRIDVDERGDFIIVDYKTGGYPLPRTSLEQEIFQLPVYAALALATIPGKGPALRRPVGLAYYDLAGRNGGPARDVVLYNRDVLGDQPATKPRASSRSAEDFERILNMSMDKARKAAEGILNGDFTTMPRDESRCRWCSSEGLCENDREE